MKCPNCDEDMLVFEDEYGRDLYACPNCGLQEERP